MSGHVLTRWLTLHATDVGRHSLVLMSETDGARAGILDDLRTTVRGHYVDPELTSKRLASLGAPKTALLIREHLPTEKTARSGDLGEILATEIAEMHLQYTVPVRRLRWKDGRNMALRGDDIIGLARKNNRLAFLKGESKSREALTASVLDEAGIALDSDRGRPTRHSVLFVAERLRDQDKDDVAQELEQAVLQSFKAIRVEHMLFALTGSNPEALLTDHLKAGADKLRRRYAVGVRIKDHGEFIEDLFSGL
jgi:hypothetical protein